MYICSTFEAFAGPPSVVTCTMSKTWKELITVSTTTMTRIGRSSGMVIRRNIWISLAPSTRAGTISEECRLDECAESICPSVTRAQLAATRILMIDGANGAGCHQELEVRADRSGGQELINAVEDYARTINGIRASVMGVMKSLNDTSSQLSTLAEAASGEANTAASASAFR